MERSATPPCCCRCRRCQGADNENFFFKFKQREMNFPRGLTRDYYSRQRLTL